MECRTRTAWPLRARSQREMSTVGLSGLDPSKTPFQVLPSNGCRTCKCGLSDGASAPTTLDAANQHAPRRMVSWMIFNVSVLVVVVFIPTFCRRFGFCIGKNLPRAFAFRGSCVRVRHFRQERLPERN